ncbi:hypothetical protein OS493_012454 [Desmophyllum pertusum]|uniref:Uncharacterized protein n=1 Tax=Desmophyllum pertusum TaxID=174260 RepID=A0A9W9ZRF6_9CNID|nr:hypothetical protein OS493_012454 [Desmophyllum pertusum]
MSHFAYVLSLNLALMRHVYKTTFNQHPTIPHELNPQTVGQAMHDLCEDKQASLEKIKKLAREGEVEESPEINYDALPHRPQTAFKVNMSESEDEEGSSAESDSTGPRTPSPEASRGRPSDRKKKEEASAAVSSSPVATTSKRLHHTLKKCPVEKCSFQGSNLKRHLQVHVRKGKISKEEVNAVAAIIKTGKRQRGRVEKRKAKNANTKPTKKGRFKKWCPMEGCSQVVLNVGRHLTEGKRHGLKKDSVEYKLMVKNARRYTGYGELNVVLSRSKIRNDDDEEMREDGEVEEAQDEGQAENNEDQDEDEAQEEDQEDSDSEEEEEEEEEEDSDSDSEDSNSDAVPDKMNNLEFFTFRGTKTNRQRWLVGFYTYLARPAAGNKKQAVKLQHASQMCALLEACEPGGDDITCLAEDAGDAVWLRWVQPMLDSQGKKPGTIVSYLTSYEMFLRFVNNPRYSTFGAPLNEDPRLILKELQPEIKGWRATIDAQTQDIQNQRYVDETASLLNADEVVKLRSSKPYVDSERIILQASQGKKLSEQEFAKARDFIISRFSIDCATRPGPVNNAKLSDYEAAETYDDVKVMLVARHKRSKDGPAILAMVPDLKEKMDIYLQNIRPQFAQPDEDKIFVTVDGCAFREGTVGRRITNFCEKAGICLKEERLAAVDWRKLVATATKEKATPEEGELVRRVMAHSKTTAERAYVRIKLTKLGAEAVKVIARVIAPEPKKEEKVEQNDDDAPEKPSHSSPEPARVRNDPRMMRLANLAFLSHLKKVHHVTRRPSATNLQILPLAYPLCLLSSPSRCPRLLPIRMVAPTPPKALSEKQKEAIKQVFKEEISNGKKTTIEEAQRKCCTTSVLGALSFSKSRVKQIVNHVNYLVGPPRPTVSPQDLPVATGPVDRWALDLATSSSSTSSFGSRTREVWNETDATLLERKFRHEPSLPTTTTIRAMLSGDRFLNEILERKVGKRSTTS